MKKLYFTLACTLLIIASCRNEKSQKTLLPHVIGNMNDVVIIMSTNNWEAAPGNTIRSNFEKPFPAIPLEEPMFDILWMPHSGLSKVIKKQRNIIITNIGPDYKENISFKKSLWANMQLVIQINAPNAEAFTRLFEENASKIERSLQDSELERVQFSYKSSEEVKLRQMLESKYNLSLTLPTGYKVNSKGKDFIWFDNRFRNTIEGILVYYYPYTDPNTFSKEFLIAKRDSILKKYVPGETEGSYAATEIRYPVITSEYRLNGDVYTYELRGLWRVIDGMAMGGPFVSISQFDEERGRIVTVDGFLFAPGEDKRNLVKRLEAVLYSLKFPEKQAE